MRKGPLFRGGNRYESVYAYTEARQQKKECVIDSDWGEVAVHGQVVSLKNSQQRLPTLRFGSWQRLNLIRMLSGNRSLDGDFRAKKELHSVIIDVQLMPSSWLS